MALAIVGSAGAVAAEPSAGPVRYRVGYKAGHGNGYVGLDATVELRPHLALGLYAAPILDTGARGVVLAPMLQLGLHARGSSPYLEVGVPYRRVRFGDVAAGGVGLVINGGYEWVVRGRISVQVGAGLRFQGAVAGRLGATMTTQPGYLSVDGAVGLRYLIRWNASRESLLASGPRNPPMSPPASTSEIAWLLKSFGDASAAASDRLVSCAPRAPHASATSMRSLTMSHALVSPCAAASPSAKA